MPAVLDVHPAEVAVAPDRRSVGDHLGEDTGKEFVEDGDPARLEHVTMSGLWHSAAVHRPRGRYIAVDHHHRPIVFGGHPGGEHAGHARAEYNSPFTQYRHVPPLTSNHR
ncbi:hypothetical protein GCM10010533_55170 [Mycolicibacterium pallens]